MRTWTGFSLEQMVVNPTTSEKSMLTEVKSSQVLIGSSPALQDKPTSKTKLGICKGMTCGIRAMKPEHHPTTHLFANGKQGGYGEVSC